MPTNVLDNIKGRELPKAWAEKINYVYHHRSEMEMVAKRAALMSHRKFNVIENIVKYEREFMRLLNC